MQNEKEILVDYSQSFAKIAFIFYILLTMNTNNTIIIDREMKLDEIYSPYFSDAALTVKK